jgi:hypothetical protein
LVKLVRQAAVGLVLAAAVLAAVIAVGRWSRGQLKDDPAYAVKLDDIDFDAPPGMSRRDFLADLHYLARDDDRFSALDMRLGQRMKELFGRHPAVAEVVDTTVSLPNKVHVELRFKKR